MASEWTRPAIERRVDELRREHRGKAFARAVKEFANESLEPAERDVLREILLERAGEAARTNDEVNERLREGGWFRRTMRKLEDSTDFEKRRDRGRR